MRQVLVLGAGLDTFAYRLEAQREARLRVFELDHPATQRDKRRRLAGAGIDEPAHVVYVAHDFERGSMTAALEAGGFDVARRTFVLWLGVTPYLTEAAVFATLDELARFPGGAEVVFDYANPAARDRRCASCASSTTRWRRRWRRSASPSAATLDTCDLRRGRAALGYVEIEDLDRAALVARYLPQIATPPRPGPGGHVVRMATL